MAPTVLVDAENVRRSVWPNIGPRELAELSAEWGRRHTAHVVVVFDGSGPVVEGVRTVESGPASADDELVALARAEDGLIWLVTSDRELRERVGNAAERVIGGGTFARELLRTD
ncbi:MAG TPA: hypothetical protein VFR43_03170 [Gaiellaceae bacterium]|nr:hypothetical protein [Gaiellaceae bacterium]